jgi:hypothetical protein
MLWILIALLGCSYVFGREYISTVVYAPAHPINAVACSFNSVFLTASINGVMQLDENGNLIKVFDVPRGNWIVGQTSGDGRILVVGTKTGGTTHGSTSIPDPPISSLRVIHVTDGTVVCPSNGPLFHLTIDSVALDYTGQHQIVSATNTIYPGGITPGGVYISRDYGTSWVQVMEIIIGYWSHVAISGGAAYVNSNAKIFMLNMSSLEYSVIFVSSISDGVTSIVSNGDAASSGVYFTDVSGVYMFDGNTTKMLLAVEATSEGAGSVYAVGSRFLLSRYNKFSLYDNYGKQLITSGEFDFGKASDFVGCVQIQQDSARFVSVGNTFAANNNVNDFTTGSALVVVWSLNPWSRAVTGVIILGTLSLVALMVFTVDKKYFPERPVDPNLLCRGIIPGNAAPGRHIVPTNSNLYRYLSGLVETGGRRGAPVVGYRLVQVEAVVSLPAAYSAFSHRTQVLQNLRAGDDDSGGDDFFNRPLNEYQQRILDCFRQSFHQQERAVERRVNTFNCFHGPRIKHVVSICKNGPVSTGQTDPGYFGSGCYSTLNIEYAIKYAHGLFDHPFRRAIPTDGRFPVIMFAASVGMTYPVTRETDYDPGKARSELFGGPLKKGYDCHVACVSENAGFQAVNREDCDYVEVVVEQFSQMLPIAVLWFVVS